MMTMTPATANQDEEDDGRRRGDDAAPRDTLCTVCVSGRGHSLGLQVLLNLVYSF
ncbi:hypothetical protein HETIRDRAFT_416442 [Heterobasidion irregulare TC 32-1]|uniref:Uncharacterized protein n=1 Tax=Heterobasidion irregulare (strain TC 32-1) TaxID=747525 RepID=W4KG31_HETIT|nr:uncharacterized protein HETIRDRAFT_416442 [Heterobasidion irregulare TC 32-1]ETW84803.1 hypothetical protein HETIRDRAFT_416442 [Heterobasidion irregulare TC 32-1]